MRVFQRTGSKMEIWDWFTYCPAGKEDIIGEATWPKVTAQLFKILVVMT